jgi:hypothetical protein
MLGFGLSRGGGMQEMDGMLSLGSRFFKELSILVNSSGVRFLGRRDG